MSKTKSEKMVVHWWEDAQGRHTCHRNDKGLSFDASLLGFLVYKEGSWWYSYATPDSVLEGPFKSLQACRKAFEKEIDGRTIDSWE